MEMSKNKVTERLFNALIVLFFATPFLFLLYGQLQQAMVGVDLQEILEMNPYLNVVFITSFITPFIGFYMLQLKKELDSGFDLELILIQLLVVTIGFIVMGNVTYGLFVSILVYFYILYEKIKIKDVFNYIRTHASKLSFWVRPTVVMAVSLLVRVMLTLVN